MRGPRRVELGLERPSEGLGVRRVQHVPELGHGARTRKFVGVAGVGGADCVAGIPNFQQRQMSKHAKESLIK